MIDKELLADLVDRGLRYEHHLGLDRGLGSRALRKVVAKVFGTTAGRRLADVAGLRDRRRRSAH